MDCTIERFRCTTSHHLRWGELTSGPISRAKKRPKKRGNRPFQSKKFPCSGPISVVKFMMYLQKDSKKALGLRHVNKVSQISPEIATEIAYVAG